jgi:hypothetical protein
MSFKSSISGQQLPRRTHSFILARESSRQSNFAGHGKPDSHRDQTGKTDPELEVVQEKIISVLVPIYGTSLKFHAR